MGKIASPGITSRFILLSDIAHSSKLAEEHPQEYPAALDRHNALVEQTVVSCGGEIYKNTGDGYYAFFDTADECIAGEHGLAASIADLIAEQKAEDVERDNTP